MKPYFDDEAEEEFAVYGQETVVETVPWGIRVREWAQNREYLYLLGGAPAVLALAAGLVLGGFLMGWRATRAEPGLRARAEQALKGQDYETARVAFHSLLRIGGRQAQQDAFQLMQTLYGLGRQHEAALLVLQLAPMERLGYAPAHVFVARALLAQPDASPVILGQATSHLERALRGDPANADIRGLLSEVYLSRGNLAAAKPHLLELAATRPEAMLRLAMVLDAEGDRTAARSWAERAARAFRAQTESQAAQTVAPYISWATALTLHDDYPGAFQVLQRQWRATGDPELKSALARLCANWAVWLERRRPDDVAARFRAVQEGLQLEPGHSGLLQQLASLSSQAGAEGEQARTLVAEMIREDRSTGLLHFCLGGEAWTRGDRAKAFEHFRHAYAVAPEVPLIANNMALTLIWHSPPDVDRALAIAESLVQQHPRSPAFRDTRGQVLVRAGRPREALADLAFALPLLTDKSATHRALAECYRSLGLNDLAAEHERAAGEAGSPGAAR